MRRSRWPRELGAPQEAPARAVEALRVLAAAASDLCIVTCPADMGEDEARAAGFSHTVVLSTQPAGPTTADDTRRAAREMVRHASRPPALRGRRRHRPRHPRRHRRHGNVAGHPRRRQGTLRRLRRNAARRRPGGPRIRPGRPRRHTHGRGDGHRRGRLPPGRRRSAPLRLSEGARRQRPPPGRQGRRRRIGRTGR